MILVAGGSGRLGGHVVRGLAADGHAVRVLTRDLDNAAHLASVADVVTGDVREPDSLVPAMLGVTVIVSAMHGFIGPRGISPKTVDEDGNAALFAAAGRAGADVVLMSVVGASADSPLELVRAKHSAEQRLHGAGLPATVVRATAFMETWMSVLRGSATSSGRLRVFGRGTNPINFVAAADVGELVVRCVADATTRGATLEIGGPEDMTLTEFAEAVAAADGRPLAPAHVPRAALRLMAATIGRVKPELGRQARAALALDTTPLSMASGQAPTRLADVLRTERVTGPYR